MTERSSKEITGDTNEGSDEASDHGTVRVWDFPTRLFHWTLVGLVMTCWYTADQGWMRAHLWSGCSVLTLLLFRITWGIVGSTTSRFSDFITGPGAVIGYLRVLAKGKKPLHAGHNPAGGWMVMVLIVILLAQVTLGLFANDDVRFNAPFSTLIAKELSDRLTEIHGMLFSLMLLLIWVHVVAAGFYTFVKGENLIRVMISGHKHRAQVPSNLKLRFRSGWIALVILVVSGVVVILVTT